MDNISAPIRRIVRDEVEQVLLSLEGERAPGTDPVPGEVRERVLANRTRWGGVMDNEAVELQPVLSIDEAADYLRIEPKAIVQMAREKRIGSLKTGRVVTFPRVALEKYVEENTVEAVPNPWGLTDAALRNVRNGRAKRKAKA